MKDLSHLRYFLGLEVAYACQGYLVSQQEYTSDLINRACFNNTHIATTPIELHQQRSTSNGRPLSYPARYRQIVEPLVNLTISRPDVVPVRVLS